MHKQKQSSYAPGDFKRDARNPTFVGAVFWLFLSALGLGWPTVWSFVFAMMLGFVLFDVLFSLFVKGRTIPISGSHLFKPEGWVFGAFLFGVAIATIVSAVISQAVTDFLTQGAVNRLWTVLATAGLGFILYVDFATRAYWRD